VRRRATIGALLLIVVGIALGATVFRTDIAQATGLAQAVTVDNTSANPVPVREQNLDAQGNVKVHEQGETTQVLFVGDLAAFDFEDVEVAQYKEVRVAWKYSGGCGATGAVSVRGIVATANYLLEEVEASNVCDLDGSRAFTTPGPTIRFFLESSNGLGEIRVVVLGRRN
jgi:hypothetical protein